MADSVVRARIDPALKKSASAVLKRIGLTTSDAFRLMMARIAAEEKLAFESTLRDVWSVLRYGHLDDNYFYNRCGTRS
jgi:DNA-damage-inducible protein J